jgi:hypothetical protein
MAPPASLRLGVAEALGVVLLVATGCGGGSASTSSPTPNHGSLLRLRVTGGKAGVFEELRVDRDGDAELSAGVRPSRGKATRFMLSPRALARLTAVLDAAKIGSLPSRPPTGCADCLEYRLSYRGMTYSADQSDEPPRLRATISAIARLITRAGSASSSASGPALQVPGK